MSRLVILNQMAGPLFIDLTIGLSSYFSEGCLLYTSHPDAIDKFSSQVAKVKLIKSPIYNRKNLCKRLFSWFKYLIGCSYIIIFARKDDIFLLSTNPPFLGIWFLILSKINKNSSCVVVYDIYPDILVSSKILSKRSIIVKFWNYFNIKAYENASCIITISNGLAKKLSEVHSHYRSKIQVVYPWADTEFMKPINLQQNKLYQKLNPDGKKIILYAGNMGISHDIESIVMAAELLRCRDDFCFLFVGGGDAFENIKNFKKNKHLSNISIHGYQPLHLLPHLLSLASVSLVALEDDKQELMVPSKLFSYLAAGSPVIGICSSGNEVHSIINSNKCGVCVPPGNPKVLAQTLVNTLDDDSNLSELRINSRSTAVKKFSKKLGVSQFIQNFYRYDLIRKKSSLI